MSASNELETQSMKRGDTPLTPKRGRVAAFANVFSDSSDHGAARGRQRARTRGDIRNMKLQLNPKNNITPGSAAPVKSNKFSKMLKAFEGVEKEKDLHTSFKQPISASKKPKDEAKKAQVVNPNDPDQGHISGDEDATPMQKGRVVMVDGDEKSKQMEAILADNVSQMEIVDEEADEMQFQTGTVVRKDGQTEAEKHADGMKNLVHSLKPENVMFEARMMFDYAGDGPTEISVSMDDNITVYEVSEDGTWILAVKGDTIGWVPMSYVQKLDTTASEHRKGVNQHGEDLAYNAQNPTIDIRQTVVNFVAQSSLFSESRLLREINVFVEDVDACLRGGRTIPGALACMLHFDDQRRKFNDFESLSKAIQELRDSWDDGIKECMSLLESEKQRFFGADAPTNILFMDADFVLMSSTAGISGITYLKDILDQNEEIPVKTFDELSALVSNKHKKWRTLKLQDEEQTKENIQKFIQDGKMSLFSSGFIDLDMRSLEQMLARSISEEEICTALSSLAEEGRSFESFGDLMGAVYEIVKGEKAPDVVTRPYIKSLKESKGPEMTTQQKIDMIMKCIANPMNRLFSEAQGNMRIKADDLQAILNKNPLVETIICDIRLMSAAGIRLQDFGEVAATQSNSKVEAMKSNIVAFLKSFNQLRVPPDTIGEAQVVELMAQSECYSNPLDLLKGKTVAESGPYRAINDLAAILTLAAKDRAAERQKQQQELLQYLGSHSLFSVSIQVFINNIENVLDACEGSAAVAAQKMDGLLEKGKTFEDFASLIAAIKEE